MKFRILGECYGTSADDLLAQRSDVSTGLCAHFPEVGVKDVEFGSGEFDFEEGGQ